MAKEQHNNRIFVQENKNMIDGKESEETTTKDKCKSFGLYPKHQWLQQKRKKKMTSTTPKTHIIKDKKVENINELPMSFPISVIC